MEHVDVDGRRIAFRRAGRGPLLLFAHGAVSDGRVWRGQLEAFADAFTVVAWDAPGCGDSDDVPAGCRMDGYADCLAGFIGALGLGAAHVVGHSWGSTLALQLGLDHPALVRSLVLVGPYAGWSGSLTPDEVEARRAFAHQVADLDPTTFDPHAMRGLFSDVMADDTAHELAHIMRAIRPAATRTMADALAASDLRHDLARIDVPTLVVVGEADERSPVTVATDLQRRIAHSTLTVLPGLGHECYLESPAAFAIAVRAFLESLAD
jgi:pimeloyl-ACP methyl ester carboxylesterase